MRQNIDEIQTRREFFKKATRRVLPIIIGGMTLSSLPTITNAAEMQILSCPGDCYRQCGWCSYNCYEECRGTCKDGCDSTCSGRCSGECHGNCKGDCTGNCNKTCQGGCQNSCSGSCSDSCAGSTK